MNRLLILYVVIVSLTSCGSSESQNKNLVYRNIIILSDLSSRIDNKPSKDMDEIHKIVQYFKNECVKPGEKIGDKSSICFSTFSNKAVAIIDVGKIKNLGEKQQFINSTGTYQKNGFTYQINDFEQKVKNSYANVRNQGLDLISILNEKMENEAIVKENTYLTDGVDTTFINYDNHIYLFTDGYLEYRNKGTNSQFFFGSSEIDAVRQFCKANKLSIANALASNSSLCLPPSKSIKNKAVNLHVLETHERDKDDKLQTYAYPTGQRDNEILEAVWRKWAIESGFNTFEWRKY